MSKTTLPDLRQKAEAVFDAVVARFAACARAAIASLSLSALHTGSWMLFVMANRDDANAIRKNPVKDVIWEPLQVRPAQK